MTKSKSTLVKGCLSKACSPPPVGTGGSLTYKKKAAVMAKAGKTVKVPPVKVGSKSVSAAKGAVSAKSGLDQSLSLWDRTRVFRKMFGAVAKGIKEKNPKLNEVLDVYGSEGYAPMNQTLRTGKPVPAKLLSWAEVDSHRELYEIIDRMAGAFKTAPRLEGEMQLFRTIDTPLKLKKGAVISDKGFVSTSLFDKAARGVSVERSGFKSHTVFRITAKKGTRYLPGLEEEQELILAPGSRFRVTGSSQETEDDKSFTIYDVELL